MRIQRLEKEERKEKEEEKRRRMEEENKLSSLDRDCSALAGLFQIIVNDLRNGGPMWEDFIAKTSKLHHALKTTLGAFSGFLDAFQRIADSATHARGATKDVGAVLTRLSMRQRAIEARLKSLTKSLTCCIVLPLQEKLEEWRRLQQSLDKEHTKEYKKMRVDIKKRTEKALRLQKKAKKTGRNSDLSKAVENTLGDLVTRYGVLEDIERTALRNALTEERSRYCIFAHALKPVLEEEVGLVSELTHVQEVMEQLEKHSTDPQSLPPSSEQVVEDVKSGEALWAWRTPPSSPASSSPSSSSSLGSRKSSACSISSLNSSSSSSTHSPSHHGTTSITTTTTASKTLRARSASSGLSEQLGAGITGTSFPTSVATVDRSSIQHKSSSATSLHALTSDRPHTISSAYERGKDRPPLTVYTFQPPSDDDSAGGAYPRVSSQPVSPVCYEIEGTNNSNSSIAAMSAIISRRSSRTSLHQNLSSSSQESLHNKPRPPVPLRCSSLERPSVPDKRPEFKKSLQQHLQLKEDQPLGRESRSSSGELPSTVPDFHKAAPDMVLPQPLYSNMSELKGNLEEEEEEEEEVYGSTNRFGSQPNVSWDHQSRLEDIDESKYCMLRPHSLAVFPSTLGFPLRDAYVKGFTAARQTGSLRRKPPPPPVRRTPPITTTTLSKSSFPSNDGLSASLSNASLNSCPSNVNSPVSGINSPVHSSSANTSANTSSLQKTDSESSTPVGSMENLPPPPAFLLEESNYGEDGSDSRVSQDLSSSSKPNQKPPVNETQSEQLNSQSKRISVSETVKSLQNIHHQPPSPITHRRSQSFRVTPSAAPVSHLREITSVQEERKLSLDGPRAALISSLNAKLAISNPALGSLSKQSSTVKQIFPMYGQPPQKGSCKVPRNVLTSLQEGSGNGDLLSNEEMSSFKRKSIHAQQQQQQKQQQQPSQHWSSNNPPSSSSTSNNCSPILPRGDKGVASKRPPHQDTFLQNLNMVLAQRPSLPSNDQSNHTSFSPKMKQKRKPVSGAHITAPATAAQIMNSPVLQRSSSSASEKASKVRSWISSKKVSVNSESTTASLRESLLDQIRRGTVLRRAKHVADRSAPRVR